MNNLTLNIKTGTLAGTCTVIIANITTADLVKTAVLAAVGAVISCAVSLLVKWLAGAGRNASGNRKEE